MRRMLAAIAATLFLVSPASAQCPAVGTPAKEFTLKEGFEPDPSRHQVTAGGNLNLGACGSVPGKGWVTKNPDFVVNYTTKGGKSRETLTFKIESAKDSILLINGPDNRWFFNDDGGKGLNAKLSFPAAMPGRYDVWVGSFHKGQFFKARLAITELEAQKKGVCPAPGQAAEEFSINEGFQPDPIRRNVTAGGDINLGTCKGVPGKGWVTKNPDFVVRYKTKGGRAQATLTFRIESAADTVLLINDPQEKWHFNDDGGRNLNARISFKKARPGRYDIWVGSFNQGQLPKAKLIVTEID